MTISCNQNPFIEINHAIQTKIFLFLNIFNFVRIFVIDNHFGFDSKLDDKSDVVKLHIHKISTIAKNLNYGSKKVSITVFHHNII